MPAKTSNASPARRRRRGGWGPTQWLIVLLLWPFFALLSGCAGIPRAPIAEPPQLTLTEAQRNGEVLCIRGRLPFDDTTVADIGLVAVGEAARATCQANRADSIVATVDAFNVAWREWAAQQERARRGRR